jgi:hypothetical protein
MFAFALLVTHVGRPLPCGTQRDLASLTYMVEISLCRYTVIRISKIADFMRSTFRYCIYRSTWPRGPRRRSAAERLLGSGVRIPLGAWMFVSCIVFVLSGRGLCDGPIPRPEESYRLWCVSECDQVKSQTLYTYCEQVGRRGRTTKRNDWPKCTACGCCVTILASGNFFIKEIVMSACCRVRCCVCLWSHGSIVPSRPSVDESEAQNSSRVPSRIFVWN